MAVASKLRPSAAKKWFWRITIVLALAWTVYGLVRDLTGDQAGTDLSHALHRLPWMLIPLIIFEICFDIGLIMMAVGATKKVSAGGRRQSLRSLRNQIKELAGAETTNGWFRWGFSLNFLGAIMVTGLIPIVAIIWVFPINMWAGLMILPCLDLVASIVWRVKVRPRRKSGASTSQLASDSLVVRPGLAFVPEEE